MDFIIEKFSRIVGTKQHLKCLLKKLINLRHILLLEKLVRNGHLHDARMRSIQRKSLQRILRYAKEHSAYYREMLTAEISEENVFAIMEALPVLTRKDIMREGERIKSDNFERMPKIQLSTSGTTGVPLKFYRFRDYEYAHQNFLYKYITNSKNWFYDSKKIVSFGGAYLDDESLSKKIFWKNDHPPLYGCTLFSSFYLTEENLPFYIAELERLQPTFIRSYPSTLLLFIELCKKTGLHADVVIEGVYVTSENVTRENMLLISNYFHAPVHGQYGHSEACVFGFTKNCDTRYFCSDLYGYVQVVDENGRQVRPGETGRVVVTSYLNRVMPFIKYETGDLAVYGGRENGFTVLAQLIGRTQDYILNADGIKLFLMVSLLDAHRLYAMNHVMHWQAIQDEPGKMRLKIVKKDSYTPNEEVEIYRLMRENKVETAFEYVDDIPLTKAGKRKYIIQNISA